MPKDRRVSFLSSHRATVSPYACSSRASNGDKSERSLPPVGDEKEWEEAKCPICIDHPHNAVLLICSSRENGCHPYMCDTSYRHSNCLDQFRKSTSSSPADLKELVCPLCRGQIIGSLVIETARRYMNSKVRSCSRESCNFSGNYTELRKHARREHPTVRPSEVDYERESQWLRMQHESNLQDTLSAVGSQFGIDYDWDEGDLLDSDTDDYSDLDLDFDDFFQGISSEDTEWAGVGDMLVSYSVQFSLSYLNDSFSGFSSIGGAITGGSSLTGRRPRSTYHGGTTIPGRQSTTRSATFPSTRSNFQGEATSARGQDTIIGSPRSSSFTSNFEEQTSPARAPSTTRLSRAHFTQQQHRPN